jgi:hypothetical protein
LDYEIEQLYIEGLNVGQIARQLECPREVVIQWMAQNMVKDSPAKDFTQWGVEAQERLMADILEYDLPPHTD